MEQVCIYFSNKEYQCTLFSSREQAPFFYWCYFEDEELVKDMGDCVGFVEKEGCIETTENFPPRYTKMVEQIRQYIFQHYQTQPGIG